KINKLFFGRCRTLSLCVDISSPCVVYRHVPVGASLLYPHPHLLHWEGCLFVVCFASSVLLIHVLMSFSDMFLYNNSVVAPSPELGRTEIVSYARKTGSPSVARRPAVTLAKTDVPISSLEIPTGHPLPTESANPDSGNLNGLGVNLQTTTLQPLSQHTMLPFSGHTNYLRMFS
ncbi:unnamed protein product, partial [Linum tenue]